jgi:hypothetical protein
MACGFLCGTALAQISHANLSAGKGETAGKGDRHLFTHMVLCGDIDLESRNGTSPANQLEHSFFENPFLRNAFGARHFLCRPLRHRPRLASKLP